MPIELPIPFILAALPFVLYALRRRGWKFLLIFAAFWVYCVALIDAVLFPMFTPEPGVGFSFASRWEQFTHLYRTHGLNLVPFYFGNCRDLPNACRRGILENILMTVPFGALYPLLHPLPARRVPLLALLVGLGTETAQLLTMLLIRANYRSVDINDTIFNALGVILGYLLLQTGRWAFHRVKQRIPALAYVTFPDQPRYTLQMNPADPEAFAALYRQHLPAVYRYLYRRVGNTAEAEDLTAQTFTEAFDAVRRNSFRPESNFPAFLFTIARRRVADFYRQRPEAPLTEHPDSDPGLLAALEARDDIQRLKTLLAQLDEEKQELLRLRFSAGLNFAEIALLEGKSEAAIKMSLYRTLNWLREHWEVENG
jgi:RNA polymerase sigma-70 factor (ECF subfamily)